MLTSGGQQVIGNPLSPRGLSYCELADLGLVDDGAAEDIAQHLAVSVFSDQLPAMAYGQLFLNLAIGPRPDQGLLDGPEAGQIGRGRAADHGGGARHGQGDSSDHLFGDGDGAVGQHIGVAAQFIVVPAINHGLGDRDVEDVRLIV